MWYVCCLELHFFGAPTASMRSGFGGGLGFGRSGRILSFLLREREYRSLDENPTPYLSARAPHYLKSTYPRPILRSKLTTTSRTKSLILLPPLLLNLPLHPQSHPPTPCHINRDLPPHLPRNPPPHLPIVQLEFHKSGSMHNRFLQKLSVLDRL